MTIRKTKKGYKVVSKSTNRKGRHKNLGGPYKSRKTAIKRERQVEWFKYHPKK